MNATIALQPTDIRGISQLVEDAIGGVAYIIEALQKSFSFDKTSNPSLCAREIRHQNLHKIVTRFGGKLDAVFLSSLLSMSEGRSYAKRDAMLAALNGVLGDHLRDSSNPLAIPMRIRYNGTPLGQSTQELVSVIPHATDKLLVMVHGLCMNDQQWLQPHSPASIQGEPGCDNRTLYSILAQELGYIPVYLHYNSGLHISTNGREFAEKLESLVLQWPVPLHEIVIIANSMGGLVTRSACHYSTHSSHHWVKKLSKLFFLGTPHHGSPLERMGNWVDSTLTAHRLTAPFASLGKIRSAGITDLRYGNLLDEDWQGRDRFERTKDQRSPVPLPQGVRCYVLAATKGKRIGDIGDLLFGDGLVPLSSALGQHHDPQLHLRFPESRRWIGYGMGHMGLIEQRVVYERIKGWLAPEMTQRSVRSAFSPAFI